MDSSLIGTLTVVLGVVWAYVTLWFLVALYTKRNDVADIAWGPGIALVAITALLLSDGSGVRVSLLTALVFFWGIRLSLHILTRTLKKTEDYRYKAWRDAWGKWFILRSYGQVFLLQGLLMIGIGYPVIHASVYDVGSIGVVDILGVIIWVIGLLFEAVSDMQLRRFIKTNRTPEAVCDVGLWRYSRHPNYFGEILMWCGIALPVLFVPYGFVALISPVTITLLILYVSGVPLLEARLMERPQYRAYAERTSVLIPLPPKK